MKRLLFILFLYTSLLSAQNYINKSIVLDAGGNKLSSSGYNMNLSFGQPIASNTLSSSNYGVVFGFYCVDSSATGAYPGIEDNDFQNLTVLPFSFSLSQCFPNPFNNQCLIKYSIPIETDVNLNVYNNSGQMVGTLVNDKQQPGHYNVTWNINNVTQSNLPNGVYFYRLKAGDFTATKKMVILR
jgi:hypothetical protein